MNGLASAGRRAPIDRAVVALGVASIASAGFALLHGKFGFVRLGAWGAAIAIGLGLCAILAGLAGRRLAAAATGAAFVAAAASQVLLWAISHNWLRGDGSTASLWLGLGVGLLATGLARRIWPDENATDQ